MRVTLEFTLTPEERIAATRWHLNVSREHHSGRRALRRAQLPWLLILVSLAIFGLASMGFFLMSHRTAISFLGAAQFVVCVLLLRSVAPGQSDRLYDQQVIKSSERRIRFGLPGGPAGVHRVRIGPRGVRIDGIGSHWRLDWSVITECFAGETGLLLSFWSWHHIAFVPMRAFASGEQFTETIRFVQSRIAEAEEYRRALISDYLAQFGGKCSRCNYDLRGTRSEMCPECGLFLTASEVLSAPKQSQSLKTP